MIYLTSDSPSPFKRLGPIINPGRGSRAVEAGGGSARRAHCVHATIEDSRAALLRRDLPSSSHSCLGIATPNRKITRYGKPLSHLETSGPWVGRLHAVLKPLLQFRKTYSPY